MQFHPTTSFEFPCNKLVTKHPHISMGNYRSWENLKQPEYISQSLQHAGKPKIGQINVRKIYCIYIPGTRISWATSALCRERWSARGTKTSTIKTLKFQGPSMHLHHTFRTKAVFLCAWHGSQSHEQQRQQSHEWISSYDVHDSANTSQIYSTQT
jgi:hypothetical protein